MKGKIFAQIGDDRGVSPVIGVILMVAITVILAAVIGTFVLGLGDSLQQAPQAQLDAEAGGDVDNPTLELSHNGGDTLTTSDIRVVIDGGPTIDDLSAVTDVPSEFSVGGTVELNNSNTWDETDYSGAPTGDAEVQVIHKPSESIILDTTVDFPESGS